MPENLHYYQYQSKDLKKFTRSILRFHMHGIYLGWTQILKISKRGEPEKIIWGGGNQKGGEDFQNERGI